MQNNPYAAPYSVASQPQEARSEFIKKTYSHLAGSILAFAFLEAIFLQLPIMHKVAGMMMGSWFLVLALFMGGSYFAQKWAHSGGSVGKQYFGLGVYIVLEALIFLPILLIASQYYNGVIMQAGVLTVAMTFGLSVIAFTTKKDFSFLNGFLKIASFVALGMIALSLFTPLSLGLWFSAAMIVFASLAILRDTSNIIHHYGSHQYVAASLGLFASVALLFWYLLQIIMSLTSND